MFPSIALRRSAVSVCQDTLLAGTWDTVLGSTAREAESLPDRRTTRRLLMTINIYREETPADETIALTRELLEKYAGATNIAIKEFHP